MFIIFLVHCPALSLICNITRYDVTLHYRQGILTLTQGSAETRMLTQNGDKRKALDQNNKVLRNSRTAYME
jgi:hypothetical protein